MPKQEMCKIVRDTICKQGIFGIDYHHYQIKFRIVQEMPTGSTTVYESQIFSLDKSEQEWTRLRARLLAEGWKLVESTYRHGEEMYTREIPDNQPKQSSGNEDVFATIERLAHLRDVGAITEDEYQKKKK